jgi:hypothetical protein
MDKKEIIDAIRLLAHSQGSYGRLYNALMEASEEEMDAWFNETFAEEPKNIVDMVMMIEGC